MNVCITNQHGLAVCREKCNADTLSIKILLKTKMQQKKITWTCLFYNTMLTVPSPFRFNGQHERAGMIPLALYELHKKSPIDIIVLCELIDPINSSRVLSRLGEYGWVYQSKPLPKNVYNLQLLSGGVYIVSRYAIHACHTHVFRSCTGSDSYVSKGIVYCEIVKNRQKIHVFATHLQAWDNLVGRTIRCAQAQEFIDFRDRIVPNRHWPMILCGDLNMDRYQQQPELKRFLISTDLIFPSSHVSGHAFSVDPQINALVGNDDPSMYTTQSYPTGCYDTYVANQSCVCCVPQWVDYMTYDKNATAPIHVHMYPVLLKTKEPYTMKFSSTISRAHNDLSDHFPLMSHWTFPSTETKLSTIQTRTQYWPTPNIFHVLYLLVLYFIAL